MTLAKEALPEQIKTFEEELVGSIQEKERQFRYSWIRGKARFEKEIRLQQKAYRTGLLPYLLHSRVLVVLTAPVIYIVFFPFALLRYFRIHLSSSLLSRLRNTQGKTRRSYRL